MRAIVPALVLIVALVAPLSAQKEKEMETGRIRSAAVVLRESFGMPDGIPKDLLDRAECVIIFPSVKKFALGVGGSSGRGPAAARTLVDLLNRRSPKNLSERQQ